MVLQTLLCLGVAGVLVSVAASQEPINIGSRLEPMVDDYLIASLTGAELQLHQRLQKF